MNSIVYCYKINNIYLKNVCFQEEELKIEYIHIYINRLMIIEQYQITRNIYIQIQSQIYKYIHIYSHTTRYIYNLIYEFY